MMVDQMATKTRGTIIRGVILPVMRRKYGNFVCFSMSRGLVWTFPRILVWRRAWGRRRWLGDGEGWRREAGSGELELEWGVMVIEGFLWGGWAERAEEEGRGLMVVVVDMVGTWYSR